MGDVQKALFERNHYMVDQSDVVLDVSLTCEFLKDDIGAAECLRYAKQQGKAVRVVHPTDRELTRFEILKLEPCERSGNSKKIPRAVYLCLPKYLRRPPRLERLYELYVGAF